MLLPTYLGICNAGEQDAGYQAAAALMRGKLRTAIAVSTVHATVMIVNGGIVALAVHERLGLKFISKSWLNLDVVWALSLYLRRRHRRIERRSASTCQQSIEFRAELRSALVLTPAGAVAGSGYFLPPSERCGPLQAEMSADQFLASKPMFEYLDRLILLRISRRSGCASAVFRSRASLRGPSVWRPYLAFASTIPSAGPMFWFMRNRLSGS